MNLKYQEITGFEQKNFILETVVSVLNSRHSDLAYLAEYQNPGRLCDICEKVRIEIPVIKLSVTAAV